MGQDPYKYFRVEAREILDQLGQGTLDLEKGTLAPDLVPRLLRLAHTLKGAARVVKQGEVADRAHELEDALAPFRESAASVPRERIDAILALLDDVERRVKALVLPDEARAAPANETAAEESVRSVRYDGIEMDALLEGVTEANVQVSLLKKGLTEMERSRHLVELLVEHLAPRRSRDPHRFAETRKRAHTLAEELRTSWGGLERTLGTAVEQVDREVQQVREAAERIRLIPARTLFTVLERTARDTAKTLDRSVIFATRGGDLRLDAQVLSMVQGPLLQMVRNAVAHGIEPPQDRKAAGKPLEGRVTLDITRRGSLVAFACRDDGRGVDLVAVRRAAQLRGMPVSTVRNLGAKELLPLLLRGGISTSAAVTEVAGRGVGLDVVREAAERLGGEATIQTESGAGTTVEIVVPLSLASLKALVVEAAGTTLTLPLEAVQGTLRLAPDEPTRTAQGETIVHDGRVLPFVSLRRLLGGSGAGPRHVRSWVAVLVMGDAGVAALGVDRLLGTTTVVLRPLPELAPASPIVAGASLDAEGNPQLVLDPDALLAEARRAQPSEAEPASDGQVVLVVDDSLTTRMLEQSILESAGYDVHLATSGEEALEKARAQRYALFLVDVEMPGMDGFAFLEHKRADPTLRDIPAILVTSRASPEDLQRGRDAGACHYIVKSEFDQAELLEHIQALVG